MLAVFSLLVLLFLLIEASFTEVRRSLSFAIVLLSLFQPVLAVLPFCFSFSGFFESTRDVFSFRCSPALSQPVFCLALPFALWGNRCLQVRSNLSFICQAFPTDFRRFLSLPGLLLPTFAFVFPEASSTEVLRFFLLPCLCLRRIIRPSARPLGLFIRVLFFSACCFVSGHFQFAGGNKRPVPLDNPERGKGRITNKSGRKRLNKKGNQNRLNPHPPLPPPKRSGRECLNKPAKKRKKRAA